MKRAALIPVAATILALTACSAEKGKEQFETARFEEKQNNREHAISLYQEIVDRYPDSPYASQARERLASLKGGR